MFRPLATYTVPPQIAPFSFNKDLSEGVRAQVTCMIEKGDPPFSITWSKDRETIPTIGPGVVSYTRYSTGNGGQQGGGPAGLKATSIDVHSSMIVLERVTANHTGNYTCHARNSVAEVQHTAELVVRGKDDDDDDAAMMAALDCFRSTVFCSLESSLSHSCYFLCDAW